MAILLMIPLSINNMNIQTITADETVDSSETSSDEHEEKEFTKDKSEKDTTKNNGGAIKGESNERATQQIEKVTNSNNTEKKLNNKVESQQKYNLENVGSTTVSLDYEYSINNDGTATITDYIGTATDIVIPATVGDELIVIEIGEYAFYQKDLISVDIPDSIKIVGNAAFAGNTQLTHIELGNGVEHIGEAAFHYSGVTDLIIPESVITIESDAFLNNTLSRVEIRNKDTVLMKTPSSGGPFGSNFKLTVIGYDPSTAKELADRLGYPFLNGKGSVLLSPNGNSNWAQSHLINVKVNGYDENKDLEYVWTTSTNTPLSGWDTLLNDSNVSTPGSTGNHYLHVRGTGIFGSIFNYHSEAFLVDNIAPNLTISPSIITPTFDDVELIVEGFDEHSGVERIQDPNGTWHAQEKLTYIVQENNTYTFVVEDKAGNQTTKSISINNISDKTFSFEVPIISDIGDIT